MTLEKVGGEWYITKPIKFKADRNNVLQLLAHTKELEVKSLISENPDRQSMFEVDTSGTLLVFREGGGAADSLIVGKSAPNFSDRYVRKVGSDEVYLIGGLKAWLLTRKLKDWRDRTIIDVPQESIERVAVTVRTPRVAPSEESYTLERRDGNWFAGPDSTKEAPVNSFLNSLSQLRAEDFVDSSLTMPSKANVRLEILGDGPLSVEFFQNPADTLKYWVKTSTSSQIYQVNQWTARRFMKPKKEFVK